MERVVLVVDDEVKIRRVLRAYLEAEHYAVLEAATGAEALAQARNAHLVLLDIGLPDVDGLEVLQRLRAAPGTAATFVILITARAEEVDKLVGLTVGADDYITKPFSAREVIARVKTVLRRGPSLVAGQGVEAAPGSAQVGAALTPPMRFAGIAVDVDRREVAVDGTAVELSALEFDLLAALADAPGRVYSRAQLLETVWGYDFYGDQRVVDVHIRNLRRVLGDDAADPRFIGTVRGVGYKFLAAPDRSAGAERPS